MDNRFGSEPMRTVFMASGQGSQKPGMGLSLLDVSEVARTFECASDVLGRDIAALVASDDGEAAERLNETRNAQAAIAALSIGIGRALESRGIAPDALLGFSLGQISALALGGMVDDETAFHIIGERSAAMDEASRRNPGAMSALLKADAESVDALCQSCADGEVLAAANFNCPGQIVIAGTPAAVERAEEAWRQQGGRASRLATQGAFHSPLMEEARAPFLEYLETVDFIEPAIPIICNTDAQPIDSATVRRRLADHLTHPVLFQQSVQHLADTGATLFAEIGYGGVLSGLVRRIDKELERPCLQDRDSFEEFLSRWEEQQ